MLTELIERFGSQTDAINEAIKMLYASTIVEPAVIDIRPINKSVSCKVCAAPATQMVFYSDNNFSWRCEQHITA